MKPTLRCTTAAGHHVATLLKLSRKVYPFICAGQNPILLRTKMFKSELMLKMDLTYMYIWFDCGTSYGERHLPDFTSKSGCTLQLFAVRPQRYCSFTHTRHLRQCGTVSMLLRWFKFFLFCCDAHARMDQHKHVYPLIHQRIYIHTWAWYTRICTAAQSCLLLAYI